MLLILSLIPAMLVTLALVIAEQQSGAPDWRRNLEAWGLQIAVVTLLVPLLQGWPQRLGAGAPALIDGARLPLWAGFAIFLFVKDFGEYAFHRAQHAVPVLWAMHSLHHSDPDMAALTTERHFWAEPLIKQVTIWTAALTIITPTPAILALYGTASLINFLTHARLDINLGRWSWLINSPAYHRRHHSVIPEHYNSNFAAIFPIFDVIFGSYRLPEGFPPTGLDSAPQSFGELLIWPLIWDRAPRGGEARALD